MQELIMFFAENGIGKKNERRQWSLFNNPVSAELMHISLFNELYTFPWPTILHLCVSTDIRKCYGACTPCFPSIV
jgi:hypothetical protein